MFLMRAIVRAGELFLFLVILMLFMQGRGEYEKAG